MDKNMERSKTIDCIKGLAIISVICAHCNAVLSADNRIATLSSVLISNIGTAGVLCFFFISGVLFRFDGNYRKFWRSKLLRIAIPWLISSTAVYLYVYLRKPPISPLGWVNFIVGNGSYCYYITVLLCLYLLFTFLPFLKKTYSLLVLIAVTAISTLFFANSIPPTPYLNILNWIGYFAAGVLCGKNGLKRMESSAAVNIFCLVSLALYSILLITNTIMNKTGSYWGILGVITSCSGAVFLILLSFVISKKETFFINLLSEAGKESLFIYLWHMPIAGIVARIMCIGALEYLVLIRPFFVLAIMLASIKLTRWLLPHKICELIGVTPLTTKAKGR